MIGIAAVTIGTGLYSWPAAVIVFGIAAILAAYMGAKYGPTPDGGSG